MAGDAFLCNICPETVWWKIAGLLSLPEPVPDGRREDGEGWRINILHIIYLSFAVPA
jgi:hypothetical protein